MPSRRLIGLTILALLSGAPAAQTPAPSIPAATNPADSPWGAWVEPSFPFFSSVLDAGQAGPPFPARNLTPRGLILNLGSGHWVAFDIDLLRIAAIWDGDGVSPRALAPGSYHTPDRKTPGGQTPAPAPVGTLWMANGIYPGWQLGPRPAFTDPREPAPSPEEVGRGPLAAHQGRFNAIRQIGNGVILEYTAGSADVREWIALESAGGHRAIVRRFSIGPAREPLWILAGSKSKATSLALCGTSTAGVRIESFPVEAMGEIWAVHVPPRDAPTDLCVAIASGTATAAARALPRDLPAPRWPQEVTTVVTSSSDQDALVVDEVGLPVTNPWKRNIRPSDIQFLKNGTGVLVTLDGDVWMARGLHESRDVRWRRFASGLHEPLSLAIRDDEIHVFDRNGIWRLRDTNGDGEADVHELFSNAFAQTADMREFPSTIRLAPDREFIIAKGGQEATTIGKHNGSVLRISADGRHATVLGYGFRQPNIGVNPRTGLVTSSDQQGHYIPTTPLHIVRDRQFYGFLSDKLPREIYPAPIAEPLVWIPHAVNASATSQVWLFNARMGALNDALVHIGFNNPELFRVLLNSRGTRLQAAVVSLTRKFDFPPLHGAVNPADGQLYIAGFQVMGWGTTAPKLAGLGRVRYTGAPLTIPRDVAAMDKGVLLRFEIPVDAAAAADYSRYSITTWHYLRTYRYGSPQFKADGTAGIDRLAPSSAYVSKDGRAVFIGVPGMTPVMQMRVSWSIAGADGQPLQESAYLTPYELTPFDAVREGFGEIAVDLTPKTTTTTAAAAPVTVEEGRRVFERYGCAACHSADNPAVARLGPSFKGLFGSDRVFAGGVVRVTADEAYIRESILEPTAKVVPGFGRIGMGMPSYAGVLSDAQIESLILFIKSQR